MLKFYLVPIEVVDNPEGGNWRGPKYFNWRFDPDPPGIACRWSMMDYGFLPYALLLAHDIIQADHDALILNADVYAFPDNLDAPVTQNVQPFFEAIYLPVDWLTPSTTWRELLRMVAGMMQFNQRYGGMSVTHPLDRNQGILIMWNDGTGITDTLQDFSEWGNGKWAIHLHSNWITRFFVATLISGEVIRLPEDTTLTVGDLLYENDPESEITSMEFTSEIKPDWSWGYISNDVSLIPEDAEVYKDAALSIQGWNGYFDLPNLDSVIDYKITYTNAKSIFDNATLSTRLRQMTAQEQEIFLAAVASFGYDPALINTNSQLRLLVRQAGAYWQGQTFLLGGYEF